VTRPELLAAVDSDLVNRSRWETRQGDLYRARYRGLRRTFLPFPNASDINWPLVDTIVEQLKSYYFQQLFSTAQMATFQPTVDGDGQSAELATVAGQWFDYMVKNESNLEEEILHVIDSMLMLGRPCMKVVWDVDARRLRLVTVEPLHLIVPPCTRALWEADRIVHVLSYSPEAYARVPGYRNDAAFVKSITGRGMMDRDGNAANLAQRKAQRQGLTFGGEDEVVVWEVWLREGEKYRVETFSPVNPPEDIKPAQGNPFDHKKPPFADFTYEATQPDWYSPRGVTEILVPFQAQLTKSLNELNDRLTITNNPSFTTEREIPNSLNIRWRPGQILPQGVKPAIFADMDVDLERHMILMRDIAEKLVAVPDYGIGQTLKPTSGRTATEVEAMSEQNEQSTDLRMRLFRISLGRLYFLCWETLRQYAGNRLAIWAGDLLTEVPAEAVRGNYKIRPSGSPDGVTRAMLWRKAVSRMQLFNQDPFINQGELRRSVLEADDAGLVKRLFQDPQHHQASQEEEQMVEIGVMKLGHGAAVSSADDHAAHIRTILNYVRLQARAGMQPGPVEQQFLQAHLMEHLEGLRAVNPEMARAAQDAIKMVAAELGAQGGPGGAGPGGPPGAPQPLPNASNPTLPSGAPPPAQPAELVAASGEMDPTEALAGTS